MILGITPSSIVVEYYPVVRSVYVPHWQCESSENSMQYILFNTLRWNSVVGCFLKRFRDVQPRCDFGQGRVPGR
jgi:hypothetical protein